MNFPGGARMSKMRKAGVLRTVRRIIEQALKRIPSEPYPELRQVLETFVSGVQDAVNANFVGAYLVGSLATGDFDRDSDIDFLVVTDGELTNPQVESLRALHVAMHGLDCDPAQHLEGSYIPKNLLNGAGQVGTQPLWYIDNGSTVLELSLHDNNWHVRWVLRERAITMSGPDPKEMVQPVLPEALIGEMAVSCEKLKSAFLAEIDQPLAWFNTRFGQSFAVLTCCRMLHTLEIGAVNSKRAGAEWAERSLRTEWHELVRQAWAEREGVRFGLKIRQLADTESLEETARFIAYVQNELRLHR
jgi:aminoglycoside adenylyltransferase-like protein/nucleotidyltransferase-like protein